MKTLEHYSAIAENYVNGNHSDFKRGLQKLSKAELLVFVSLFEDFLPENDISSFRHKAHRANTIVHRALTN